MKAVLVKQNVDDLLRSVEPLLAELVLSLRGDVKKFGEVKCSKVVGNPFFELLIRLVVAVCRGSHHYWKKQQRVCGGSNCAKQRVWTETRETEIGVAVDLRVTEFMLDGVRSFFFFFAVSVEVRGGFDFYCLSEVTTK